MDYDNVLKAIGEATNLRKLMDSLQNQIDQKDAQIENNRREIERRQNLETITEALISERKALGDELVKHQAELNKRLAKLADAKVALPFDESIGSKPIISI